VTFWDSILGWQNETDRIIRFSHNYSSGKFAVVACPLASAGWYRWLHCCDVILRGVTTDDFQSVIWSRWECWSRRRFEAITNSRGAMEFYSLNLWFASHYRLVPQPGRSRLHSVNLRNYWDDVLLCHIVAFISSAQCFCCLSSSMCLPLVFQACRLNIAFISHCLSWHEHKIILLLLFRIFPHNHFVSSVTEGSWYVIKFPYFIKIKVKIITA